MRISGRFVIPSYSELSRTPRFPPCSDVYARSDFSFQQAVFAMFRIVFPVFVLLLSSLSFAQENFPPYGDYDLKKVLVAEKGEDGRTHHGLDLQLLDNVLKDLHMHANGYPPRFATREEMIRARGDAFALSKMFEIWLGDPSVEPEFLSKIAGLYTVAHNLEFRAPLPKPIFRTLVYSRRILTIPSLIISTVRFSLIVGGPTLASSIWSKRSHSNSQWL